MSRVRGFLKTASNLPVRLFLIFIPILLYQLILLPIRDNNSLSSILTNTESFLQKSKIVTHPTFCHMSPLPPLSIASINCNSLNMSAISSAHQKLKIYGIVKLKSDIIFLSDIRLGRSLSAKNKSSLDKTLLINPYCRYTLVSNSSSNSRGEYS